jgi:chitinase
MKKTFTCLLILFSFITLNTTAQFRIVGYLNTWDNFPNNVSNLDYTKITHLNIAFANPDAKGNLTTFPGLSTVVNKAHAKNVKVLISMGGADLGGTKKNWQNLTQPDSVKSFCKKILAYLQKHNLDGADVDLEGNIIGNNYGNFIKTLSSVLKPKGKMVTAALATWFADQVPVSTFQYFNFVNIMSYDSTGPWDPQHPGQHSPYTMAVSDLNFWSAKGLSKNKTNLGVPFYGYGFYNKVSQDEIAYKDIIKQYGGAQKDQISDTIYYNGIPTIKQKTKLALQKVNGIMIWQLTEDTQGNRSLLKAINDVAHKTDDNNQKPVSAIER